MNKTTKSENQTEADESLKKLLAKNAKEKEKQIREMFIDNKRLKQDCKRLYYLLIKIANVQYSNLFAQSDLSSSQSLKTIPGSSYIQDNIKKIQGLIKLSQKSNQSTKKNHNKLTMSTSSPRKLVDQSTLSTNLSSQASRIKQKDQGTLIMMPKINNSFGSDTPSEQIAQLTNSMVDYQIKLAELKAVNDQNIKLKNEALQLSSKLGKMKTKFKQIKNQLYALKINQINNFRKQQKDILNVIQNLKAQNIKEISQITSNIELRRFINYQNIENDLKVNIMKQVQKFKNFNFHINFDSNLKIYQDNQFINHVIQIMYPKLCQQFKHILSDLSNKASINKFQLKLSRQYSKKQSQNKQKTVFSLKQQLQEKISKLKKELEANDNLSSRQLIEKYPKLCFMSSNILSSFCENQYQVISRTQEFILESIVNYYKKSIKIVGLKQLYSYKLLNRKVNFHLQVDNHPHLLLLIKLKKSDSILVVYSERGIQQDENQSTQNKSSGFLLDVLTKKIYFCREKYQSNEITPNQEYYVAVGNHDLKIRLDSQQIESCFGTQTSMFRPNSDYTVDDILHNGQSHVAAITDYEFYQVMIE